MTGAYNRRKLQGRVVNNTASQGRAKKAVVVEVVRRYRDPVYGKYIKSRKKYRAHDEAEAYRTNDVVEIRKSWPLSATKRWVVVRLLERPEDGVEPKEAERHTLDGFDGG